MAGFTTNVEFGYRVDKKDYLVFGYPPGAEKTKYLSWIFHQVGNPLHRMVYTKKQAAIAAFGMLSHRHYGKCPQDE